MRRRLYFLVPKLKEANKIFDGLLLKRIPINRIHLIAKEDQTIGDLPEASAFQKYDIVGSMFIGIGIGAIIGIIAGIVGHLSLNIPIGGGMFATTLVGAVLGGWSASMIGMMIPNRLHKPFQTAIDQGQILMLVDVPKERIHEIQDFVNSIAPQSHFEGMEPTIPRFP